MLGFFLCACFDTRWCGVGDASGQEWAHGGWGCVSKRKFHFSDKTYNRRERVWFSVWCQSGRTTRGFGNARRSVLCENGSKRVCRHAGVIDCCFRAKPGLMTQSPPSEQPVVCRATNRL